MPSIQIGKYKRPGIFIEEFDESQIDTPTVTGTQVMVIGSSKKGPVNTPITLSSSSELSDIFGDLDRSLESRDSYFHRTIAKLLESTPVVAMNVFNPDDDLDKLQYKSLSASTSNVNDVKRVSAYRNFFDKSSFWKTDREAFLSITDNNVGDEVRPIHFTNMDDQTITIFIVKSQDVTGFETTLLEWYGSEDKVPTYLSPKDYASDYLVDLLILKGDWTNYNSLASGNWGKYFNTNGLIKSELFNIANDRNVNTLGVYRNLSMIPYFRDSSGQNIFIENVVNADTNITGLYCAYNIDLVEDSFRNGVLDLIGDGLINNNEIESIDFLSYNKDIVESKEYVDTRLDRPGNTTTLLFSDFYQNGVTGNDRGSFFGEGYINDFIGPTAGFTSSATASFDIGFTASTNAYAVIGGATVSLETTQFSVTPFDLEITDLTPGLTHSFTEVFFIDTDGTVAKSPTNEQLTSGLVLGKVDMVFENQASDGLTREFTDITYTGINVDESGYVYFNQNGNSEIIITNDGVSTITYEFVGTTGIPDVTDYANYRIWKAYNNIVSVMTNDNFNDGTILLSLEDKLDASEVTVSIENSTSANNKLKIDAKFLYGTLVNNGLVVHTVDDEFIMGTDKMVLKQTTATATEGVVAKNSAMYLDFINGIINTGDYFLDDISGEKVYLRMYDKTIELATSSLVADGTSENTDITVVSQSSNFRQTIEIVSVSNTNAILIDGDRYNEVKQGDFLEADTSFDTESSAPRKLTRVLNKRLVGDLLLVTCDSPIKVRSYTGGNLQTYRFTSVDDYVSEYSGISLAGFTKRADSLPNGTDARIEEMMSIVSKGSALFNALTDKDIIDFRYLVDSYGLGLQERSKQVLADITGKRLDAFAILNAPSIKLFRKSSSPTFVNQDGSLNTEFIKLGGDPDSNAAFNYSLADGDGATTCGYFLPYVTVNDNGRPINVPPAAYVATTYLRKHNSSNPSVTPWTISAGVTDGRITNIAGLEYSFTSEDIVNLNAAKLNPIISKKNRGFAIETENTAQILSKSSLSNIHAREVLIELERELAAMLTTFQWKYNTPEVRAEIKLRADAICEDYVVRKGLFNFFNKIDSENNTRDIIQNQTGVLDTYVEIAEGLAIIVNNIKIRGVGQIESGGFI